MTYYFYDGHGSTETFRGHVPPTPISYIYENAFFCSNMCTVLVAKGHLVAWYIQCSHSNEEDTISTY